MKVLTVGLAAAASVNALNIFTSKREANQAIASQRVKRSNGGIFEELRGGDLQRECKDETCSMDEVVEAYGGDRVKAVKFWDGATKMCHVPNTCNVEGTKLCTNLWHERICTCKEGYTNTDDHDDCRTDVDECLDLDFCANGGTCINTPGSYNCMCTPFWDGPRCREDKNECLNETPVCLNGGTCSNRDEGYDCACPANWTGDNCEIDVDECAAEEGSPCQNGSGCINSEGSYMCLCNSGWGGQNCNEDYDECANAMCPEGTSCVSDEMNRFSCVCPDRGCNNLNETLYQSQLMQVYIVDVPEAYPEPEIDVADNYNTTINYDYDEDQNDNWDVAPNVEDSPSTNETVINDDVYEAPYYNGTAMFEADNYEEDSDGLEDDDSWESQADESSDQEDYVIDEMNKSDSY